MVRAIAALLGAALAFPAVVFALGLHEALGGALSVAVLLFVTVVALGMPTLSIFCRRQWWRAWQFIAGGTVGGAVCALPFLGVGRFDFLYLLVVFALIGFTLSIGFWLAGIWRNDDLTRPKQYCLPCGAAYRYARNALRRLQN